MSHNTVVKAYSELEHEGLLEVRHGSGAFISAKRKSKGRTERLRMAQQRVGELIAWLRGEGLSADEISRLIEAELFYAPSNRRRS